MNVTITKDMCEAIGYDKFEKFDLDTHSWSWKRKREINLARHISKLPALEKLLSMPAVQSIHGVKAACRSVQQYQRAIADPSGTVMKKLEPFAAALKAYLQEVDGHRVYRHKNLLKLAWIYAGGGNAAVTAKHIAFVSTFRPTKPVTE